MPEPARRLLGYRIALARRLDDVARAQAAMLGRIARRRPGDSGDQAGLPSGRAARADSSS